MSTASLASPSQSSKLIESSDTPIIESTDKKKRNEDYDSNSGVVRPLLSATGENLPPETVQSQLKKTYSQSSPLRPSSVLVSASTNKGLLEDQRPSHVKINGVSDKHQTVSCHTVSDERVLQSWLMSYSTRHFSCGFCKKILDDSNNGLVDKSFVSVKITNSSGSVPSVRQILSCRPCCAAAQLKEKDSGNINVTTEELPGFILDAITEMNYFVATLRDKKSNIPQETDNSVSSSVKKGMRKNSRYEDPTVSLDDTFGELKGRELFEESNKIIFAPVEGNKYDKNNKIKKQDSQNKNTTFVIAPRGVTCDNSTSSSENDSGDSDHTPNKIRNEQRYLKREAPAVLLAIGEEEEKCRQDIHVTQAVNFLELQKRSAVHIKYLKAIKKGSSKQLKMEGDECYEKARYANAIDRYTKALEANRNDGTTKVHIIYGNRSAANFMDQKYSECIEDCLQVVMLSGGANNYNVLQNNTKMYQRAIKAAVMLGDLERALSLHNKIDPNAIVPNSTTQTTQCQQQKQQLGMDRMKIMLACEELKEAQKKHGTSEGCRIWECLMSKFSEVIPFRIQLADSLVICSADLTNDNNKMMNISYQKAVDVLSAIQPPARTPALAYRISLYKYRSGFEYFDRAREVLEVFKEDKTDQNTVSDSSSPYSTHPTVSSCYALYRLITNVDDQKQRGNTLFSSRSFHDSVTHYTNAINLDPGNPRILRILYCNRAAAYKELHRLKDGVDDCTRAIELDPNFSKAFARRARCLVMLADYDGAVRDFEQASKCDPGDRDLIKELKSAQERLKKELDKEKTDMYYVLGVTRATLNDAGGQQELKTKFRQLSLKWHPDKCMHLSDAEKVVSERKFKAVVEAYTTLSNPEKRREYDIKFDREQRYTSGTSAAHYAHSHFTGDNARRAYPSGTSYRSTATSSTAAASDRYNNNRRYRETGTTGGTSGNTGTTNSFW